MRLKIVSYGTSKIQQLRRVALDQNILDTLGLSIGDTVQVELDTENSTIILSKVNSKDVQKKTSKGGVHVK
ncbi:MAG: hypothetical protein H6R05_175 [Burkholderiaceae bacterium]|nr:hypothetical protein [Burkholderiaceae bacterium]